MSGNWNRTPRKGEKSITAVRSDQEHVVRLEYRDAGVIQGLVKAWSIAFDLARVEDVGTASAVAWEVAMRIACELLSLFPKRGRIDLVNSGAESDYVDAVEQRVRNDRRIARDAADAAKKLGASVDGT